MGFDYRELTTKILSAQGKKEDDDEEGNGTATRCACCDTTGNEEVDTPQTRCACCDTTGRDDEPKCKECNTTKPHDDGPGRRSAQDLMVLRQQLRDSLAAG
jgi:hypothetical protein